MITKTPIRVGITDAVDPVSGLPMYRQYINFNANRDDENIIVYYRQWLTYPTGVITDEKTKTYIVKNSAEVSHIVPEVGHTVEEVSHIVPEVGHFEDGVYVVDTPEQKVIDVAGGYVVDTPAQTIIDAAENTGFSYWFNLPIVAKADGLYIDDRKIVPLDYPVKMGGDIISGAIDRTLNLIPFDAEDGYVTHK